MRFRKKPVEVEAVRFDGVPPDATNAEDLMAWIGDQSSLAFDDETDEVYLTIDTLEGLMRANLGDWIIKGVTGEFYPCKPDIFKATYEAVPMEDGE